MASLHPRSADDGRAGWARPEEAVLGTWTAYADAELIGEGGMGRVYRAFDTRLRREVALKFIRRDTESHAARFLREARLQASVEHPHVCRIYDVGHVEGRPYIAMQYVDGPALLAIAESLSLEQKLRVMRQVSDAVHASHVRGLIHRDLKPANIRLQRIPSGDWHPYVLDFGLARERDAENLTTTDAVVGTPQYLAPEQIRGEHLDERTDIHGLGCTFYEFLTGHPAFDGSSPVEIAMRILDSDPPRLRARRADIPGAVETIVMKCLEKQPSRRYASAAELVNDLDRALAGEAIVARPRSLHRQLYLAAVRHRVSSAMGATAVVGAAVLAFVMIRGEQRSRAQATLAADYTQEMVYLERYLQHAYRRPLHDVSAEERFVRQRLGRLEAKVRSGGSIAVGPGEYAIGRVLLALRDTSGAARHLQTAWRAGYQLPEVAYALGKTIGELYDEALRQAERIPNLEGRARKKSEVQAAYRDASSEFVRRSEGVRFESAAYLAALVAIAGGDRATALQHLERAQDESPWLYESKIVEGTIRGRIGNEQRDTGDTGAAAASYAEAARALEAAQSLAPSDPAVLEATCGLRTDLVILGARIGRLAEASVTEALRACDEALTASPGRTAARLNKTNALIQWAGQMQGSGGDSSHWINQVIALAEETARLAPRNEWANYYRGVAHRLRAIELHRSGADPRAELAIVISSFRQALDLNPTVADARVNLGNAWLLLGDYERSHALPAERSYEAARAALQQAVDAQPTFVAYNNLAFALLRLAGLRPSGELFTAAVANAREAVRLQPDSPHARNTVATALWREAEWRLEGGDANVGDTLAAARRELAASSAIHPDYWETHALDGVLTVLEGRVSVRSGRDPEGAFSRAASILGEVAKRNPAERWVHDALAEAERRRAEVKAAQTSTEPRQKRDAPAGSSASRAAAERGRS